MSYWTESLAASIGRVRAAKALLVLAIVGSGLTATTRLNAQDTPEPLRGYSKFEEIEARLKRLESPTASLTSLGKTLGKRDVWLLTVANDPKPTRPAILVVGNVYAPHVLGRELATRMAEHIVQNADSDESLKSLLSQYTLYFIPSPTPDATEKNFRFPVRGWTGNLTTTDDDRDFEVGEDGPVDLNQDGWVTSMRVKESFGTHRTHPSDPRVLIPIDPAKQEVGQYRLYSESKDADKDNSFGEDSSEGVDFNRNFTFNYSYFGKGAGPNQVSEVETRAVADFMFDHPNIAFVLCFSPEDNLFNTWKGSGQTDSGRIKTKVLTTDQKHLDLMAEAFRKLHGGKSAPASPAGEGSFSEFSYFHFGRWTFASRGWWIPPVEKSDKPAETKPAETKPTEAKPDDAKPSETKPTDTKPTEAKPAEAKPAEVKTPQLDKDDKRGADELAAIAWFTSQGISGFADWQSVNHPDFPGKEVEVGGIKPLFLLNPPEKFIQPLVQPHVSFLSELVRKWPKLEVREIKAVDKGNGLIDVRCKIVNVGSLPSMPEMGSVNRQWYPTQVKLVGADGAKMIEGSHRTSVGKLEENGGSKEVRWVFLTDPASTASLKIQVSSPTLHSVEVGVELTKP